MEALSTFLQGLNFDNQHDSQDDFFDEFDSGYNMMTAAP